MSHPTLAVLISGGLDSAILLGDALRRETVVPIYMCCGLSWEKVEKAYLDRYLAALACPALKPLVVLDQPIADVYGAHWSITGTGVPDARTPTMDVLAGRTALVGEVALWCHHRAARSVPCKQIRLMHSLQELVNQAMQAAHALVYGMATRLCNYQACP